MKGWSKIWLMKSKKKPKKIQKKIRKKFISKFVFFFICAEQKARFRARISGKPANQSTQNFLERVDFPTKC